MLRKLLYWIRVNKLRSSDMYTIGIDAGSVATKGVLFSGGIIDSVIIPTGWSPQNAASQVLATLLKRANLQRLDINTIIGTGYGRVSMSFVDKTVTEITCHAQGAFFMNNSIRTILDIGGQDCKVIRLNDQGKVIDFLMNDKCAAGTGRFLQVMTNLLGEEIGSIDALAGDTSPHKISNMCTVFAESEVISLLAQGAAKGAIAAGIIEAIADRACILLERVALQKEISFTGGVARSKLLCRAIERKIGDKLYIDEKSQIIGALGAAIIGWQQTLPKTEQDEKWGRGHE